MNSSNSYLQIFEILVFYSIIGIVIFEYLGTQLFIKAAIEPGLTVFKQSIDISNVRINKVNGTFLEKEGKYKFLSSECCIFTSRFHFFEIFRAKSFLPVKGIMNIDKAQIQINGKIPIGSIVFAVLILQHAAKKTSESIDTAVILTIFLIAILAFSYFISKSRFKKMIEEMNNILFSDNYGY